MFFNMPAWRCYLCTPNRDYSPRTSQKKHVDSQMHQHLTIFKDDEDCYFGNIDWLYIFDSLSDEGW